MWCSIVTAWSSHLATCRCDLTRAIPIPDRIDLSSDFGAEGTVERCKTASAVWLDGTTRKDIASLAEEPLGNIF